jgi:hypothetical protein
MHSSCLELVEVSDFHTADAYSNLGLTTEIYKINQRKQSGVENVKGTLRMSHKSLVDSKKI